MQPSTFRIPLLKVFMAPENKINMGDVFRSGYIGTGPQVAAFEKKVADDLGLQEKVIALNSATSGLHLALHLVKSQLGKQKEVLTTPNTCVATNVAIVHHGLKARWVDINPASGNMDLNDLRKKISHRTAAIQVTHWAGNPVDLNVLKELQDEAAKKFGYRIPVIEDCAHAYGAKFEGKNLGNHGNMCVYSFQATKHLTTGDGGLLVLPTFTLAERARKLAWYGLGRPDPHQGLEEAGYKFCMNDIAATIGLANSAYCSQNFFTHYQHCKTYRERLDKIPYLSYMDQCQESLSANWIFPIRLFHRSIKTIDFVNHLRSQGIEAVSQFHDRNDKYACFGKAKGKLPGMEKFDQSTVCLPCGWWMDHGDMDFVITTIMDWCVRNVKWSNRRDQP